jgi:hypothetical protein
MFNVGSPNESVPVEIDEMTIADYGDVLSLLRASPGCFLTKESASKAQLMLDLLRTRKLNLTQIAQILARQVPPYRLDDVRWI